MAIQKYGNFLSMTITDLVNKARKDKKKKYQNMVDEFISGIQLNYNMKYDPIFMK